MRHSKKHAFTLVELLVVIAIIGTLVGLLLPAVNAAREAARSNTCRSNLTQLQKALIQRESSLGSFPGYINSLGVRGTNNQIRASWVVLTFPYIDQGPLWDLWSQPDGSDISSVLGQATNPIGVPELELLICPSDPPTQQGQPNLSYGANAGWVRRSNTELTSIAAELTKLSTGATPFLPQDRENPANGVFFDNSRLPLNNSGVFLTPNLVGPSDRYEPSGSDPGIAPLNISVNYLQGKGDGTTSTVLLSENVHQVFWAYTNRDDYTDTGVPDEKYHFGICWEQPEITVNPSGTLDEKARRINGDTSEDSYIDVVQISQEDDGSSGALRRTMPSSRHPAGVNMAFVGGNVKFVGDQIEPRVFAQIMTSNRNKSDLVFSGESEANMAPVGDDEY